MAKAEPLNLIRVMPAEGRELGLAPAILSANPKFRGMPVGHAFAKEACHDRNG